MRNPEKKRDIKAKVKVKMAINKETERCQNERWLNHATEWAQSENQKTGIPKRG